MNVKRQMNNNNDNGQKDLFLLNIYIVSVEAWVAFYSCVTKTLV